MFFGETNYFNLILIFIIGGNIIIIIRDKIKNNSLQAKRHCVPSENNSFLHYLNQSKCNSFQEKQSLFTVADHVCYLYVNSVIQMFFHIILTY